MSEARSPARLQILLPVYNEAATIEATLRELATTLAGVDGVELVVCEDGSTDGTREIITRLAAVLAMRLVLGAGRKGYARAVVDGFRTCTAPYVATMDADGQCDPRDFARFLPLLGRADVLMGYRVTRRDTLRRRAMSGLFRVLYRRVLGVTLRDPSCPFIVFSRESLGHLLAVPTLGMMRQGFWWEVVARLSRAGFTFHEVPVHHRPRAAGRTQVYRTGRLAGIFFGHLRACVRIRREPIPPRRPG
ncbi:MAG: glycosyltransferase family 2 protein [Candidatus Rokubacteria bacterium]|nr:glycosyltransferase family 2 protein [Candidatus Rokubacteria bacterium]